MKVYTPRQQTTAPAELCCCKIHVAKESSLKCLDEMAMSVPVGIKSRQQRRITTVQQERQTTREGVPAGSAAAHKLWCCRRLSVVVR